MDASVLYGELSRSRLELAFRRFCKIPHGEFMFFTSSGSNDSLHLREQ